MILLADVWDDAFMVVVNYFMKIMDWMWSLTLPATQIPLYTLWIIGGILGIIFRVIGSSPQLSTMSKFSTDAVSSGFGSIGSGISGVSVGLVGHFKSRNQFKMQRDKQQLSSLARQAKTREQGFKRIHTTKRISSKD